jgi:uncharacterized protein (TIRG00374 family)
MKRWRFWVGVLFSLAGLVMAARGVDFRALIAALGKVQPVWLVVALGLVALAMVARAHRWRLLLFPLTGLRVERLFNLLNIGYLLNSVLPFRLGDLARAYLYSELEHLDPLRVLSTVAVERVIDTLTIVALLMWVVPQVVLPQDVSRAAVGVGGMALVAIAILTVVALSGGQRATWLEGLGNRFPVVARFDIAQKIKSVVDGLASLRSWKQVLGALVWSLGAWIVTALEFSVVMKAMGLHLPFAAALMALCLSTLGMIVPSSPGHLGVFEYLTVVALSLFGVGREDALAFALLVHAVGYLAPAVLGGMAVWREGYSLAQLQAAATADTRGV